MSPGPERLGAVKAKARMSGDAERLAVELGAEAAEGSLEVGGTVLSVEKNPSVDLKLRAKHPELARLASLFADDAVSGSYGPMDLYTELAGTRKAFTLGNIQGVLAGVTVKGKASADLNGSKPRVEADLQTGDLELDRLAVLPAAAAARPAGATSPAAVTPPGASAAAAGDFSGLRRFDGRFALTSSALVKGGTRIENPALRATVTNGVLTVERFDGTLMGGQLGATGRLAAPGNQTPTAEATITLSKAKLAEAMGGGLGGGALEIAGGVLDAEANLTTSGAGGDAMLKALAGQGRISARDGLLRGFDLGVLRDRLTKLERPQELLGAVMGGLQGGETRFARLDGSFAIDKGVARTEDTRLTSDLGEAVAAGQVNLPAQTIDMRVRLTVQSDQSLPPLTVRMTGALDKPTRSFEMQEVQEYFARRAAEGLLNKVVPKDLPIPGGGNAPKPDALLKGLIDGLRR
ncbi:AsmA family protein [Azospirillum brasilense]|nr:AsmA family protein [Azospirillum brasilense]